MWDRTGRRTVQELSEQECQRLLAAHHVGRIGFSDRGQPLILPVNYAADGHVIVFRTGPGAKLDCAPLTWVAFEIDEVDQASGVAWSVLAKGVAYEVPEAEDQLSERLRRLVVQPMAPGEKPYWMAVICDEISGRRFRLPAIPAV